MKKKKKSNVMESLLEKKKLNLSNKLNYHLSAAFNGHVNAKFEKYYRFTSELSKH